MTSFSSSKDFNRGIKGWNHVSGKEISSFSILKTVKSLVKISSVKLCTSSPKVNKHFCFSPSHPHYYRGPNGYMSLLNCPLVIENQRVMSLVKFLVKLPLTSSTSLTSLVTFLIKLILTSSMSSMTSSSTVYGRTSLMSLVTSPVLSVKLNSLNSPVMTLVMSLLMPSTTSVTSLLVLVFPFWVKLLVIALEMLVI